MSYQRKFFSGEVWIEDRAYAEALVEIGKLVGELKAKNEEIQRMVADVAVMRAEHLELVKLGRDYHELLFAVARKFPNETRHQTALRSSESSRKFQRSKPLRHLLPRPTKENKNHEHGNIRPARVGE